MNLIHQVYNTLKLKKSDEYCAEKLNISLEKYRSLKSQILNVKSLIQDDFDEIMKSNIEKRILELVDDETLVNGFAAEVENKASNLTNQQREKTVEFRENLEDGTAEIKGIAFNEPKTPEEIIRILKIDTSKWKLSSYWNKQHKDYWLISAQVTQKKIEEKDLLADCIRSFKPQYVPVRNIHLNDKYSAKSCAVLSVQDLHFGKEGNDDIIDVFREAISNLVYRAYHSHHLDKIIYVIGGDLLNMDTFLGTTTKGTPVDNSGSAQEVYNKAFDSIFWSIMFIKQFCSKLEVVYVPGNHDRLSSYHLAHALSKCFKDDHITWNTDYSERKVVTYHSNFFAFEHGDVHSKDTPLVYATEFSKDWGNTSHRILYTGHYHKKRTVEYVTENERNGFAIRTIPSLSKTDYWHYHKKYTGANRAAVMDIYHREKGKICELVYNH